MSDIKSNTPSKTFLIPTFLQAALEGSRPLEATLSNVLDTDIESTSSFRYDSRGTALKSSQQLNVDWSQFENHCFFMSAEALVNTTFDQIINGYPFDGTQQEIESFFDKLTGFEKWCFDQFPKFKGSLEFNSSSYIVVRDKSGANFPTLSNDIEGRSILNPVDKSLSIEAHLFTPTTSYDSTQTQIICQKYNVEHNCGFTLYIDYGPISMFDVPTITLESLMADTFTVPFFIFEDTDFSLPSLIIDSSFSTTSSYSIPRLKFSVVSGSTFSNVTCNLNPQQYNHIVAICNRERENSTLELYNNCELLATSKYHPHFNSVCINDDNLYIGSGSSWYEASVEVIPTMQFVGKLDEFKIFHNVRGIKQQQEYHRKSITSTDDLQLYFKFNEPPPPLVTDISSDVNAIVLDSSGNNLHSTIINFTGSLRINNSIDPYSLLEYERDELSPVLFPAYEDIITLNTTLLSSASLYDDANPNLITKLIPEHWLLQGQSYDGFDKQNGDINNPYGGEGLPGQGELGSTHLILSFLFIWARYFDELKIMVDQFVNTKNVSFDQFETTPNTFLYELSKAWGIELPPLFNESSIEQYVNAENIDNEFSVGTISLRTVQDELMKRVLIHMPKILKSKGTLYSVQAFLRAIGIDPQNSVRIREFGGPSTKQLEFVREQKIEPSLMLKMNTGSLIISPFLSASRIETGEPYAVGPFVQKEIYHPHGISSNKSDGFLTSGSWTFEAIYKWPTQKLISTNTGFHATQSLCRMITSGSYPYQMLVANLLAISSSAGVTLNLFVSPGNTPLNEYKHITLNLGSDNSIFNSDKWNISFGVERTNDIAATYFIRAGTQNYGEITRYYETSSYFNELSCSLGIVGDNLWQKYDATLNVFGPFIQIGQNTSFYSSSFFCLNQSTIDDLARDTHFVGQVSNLRFWSKALNTTEFKEHIKNYKSAGVENPALNYGFNYTSSGSFERLRLDSIFQQEIRQPFSTYQSEYFDSGSIVLIDHSQNGMHLTGTGFPINENALVGEMFDHSYLSPYYDEAVSTEKIRIRGAQTQEVVSQNSWTDWAPVYEVPIYEKNTDDLRFSIEFSLIDALNRDIVTIFSTYEALNNALGNPELAFSTNYPDLENIREVYFNRIKEKIDFKAFFDFYQWFDVSIGTFIQQLIPRKANFKGTNFIVESHMLERHKLQYHFESMYLDESTRPQIIDTLLVQQIAGTIRKY